MSDTPLDIIYQHLRTRAEAVAASSAFVPDDVAVSADTLLRLLNERDGAAALLARVEEADARALNLHDIAASQVVKLIAGEARCAALEEALRSACSVLDANGYRRTAAQFLSVTDD